MSRERVGFRRAIVIIISSASLLVGASVALADIKLPAVMSDNMVLQHGGSIPIWGWADPGEEVMVSVSWHSMRWAVTADRNGKWMFKITPPQTGGPYEMTFSGKSTIKIKNILVGEVWVCSGQSNMQWSVEQAANAEQEIATAGYPSIRVFTVERTVASEPQSDCVGDWKPCSPETVAGFSAVAYFFGRELHKELGVPIGLIHTSWGGTPAEAWTSAKTLKMLADFRERVEQLEHAQANREQLQAKYEQQMRQWQEKINSASPCAAAEGQGCMDIDFNDSDWQTMELPQLWEQAGLEDFDGLVWFRKEVEVPESWTERELVLELGPIDDMDVTWVNGVRVGGIEIPGRWRTNRKYTVDSKIVGPGRNVITVRVLDTGGGGGICGEAQQLKLKPAGQTDEPAVSLAGQWRYKEGLDIKSIPPRPESPLQINQHTPSALYNAMITPLIPYGIQGAIWYQGESNAGRAYQYRTLFPTMITNWRQDWGQGNFAFIFVQLANFMATKPEPADSEWAELREAQLMTLALPNTGMAVTIDIGEANDIHPKNKQDVGRRLALWALAKTYGRDVVYSGPIYESMNVEGDKIVLHFDQVGGGLVAGGAEPLKGFAVAGQDRRFVWAEAEIEGETVVVSSDEVSEPVAVRYAWADNPACNLYNQEGLPASPFRTDDWPGITADKR